MYMFIMLNAMTMGSGQQYKNALQYCAISFYLLFLVNPITFKKWDI